jgi:hypothetical protein
MKELIKPNNQELDYEQTEPFKLLCEKDYCRCQGRGCSGNYADEELSDEILF